MLTVPFLTVEEPGQATITVPVVGQGVGDHIPLDATLALGAYRLRIPEAEIVAQRGEPRLLLHLDSDDWRDGRKLLHPGQLHVNGKGSAFQFNSDDEAGAATQLSVLLPAGTQSVTLTLLDPNVAVQGHW